MGPDGFNRGRQHGLDFTAGGVQANGDDSTNVGAAVGATLAAALLLGLLVGCGCLLCCYRRRKQKGAAYDPQAQDPYMSSALLSPFRRAHWAVQ